MLLMVLLGEVYERQPENPGDLLDIIKWSHIYDRMEESFVCAEVLANVMKIILYLWLSPKI